MRIRRQEDKEKGQRIKDKEKVMNVELWMSNRNQETGTRNQERSFHRNFVGIAVFSSAESSI